MARIADLAEHSRTRPVPELGNRGTGPGSGPVGGQGLEEALGTAIAARVREFRLQLGWTVGQLAAQSGLSKGMLSKIENAQASPSLATLARLSEALQVPDPALAPYGPSKTAVAVEIRKLSIPPAIRLSSFSRWYGEAMEFLVPQAAQVIRKC